MRALLVMTLATIGVLAVLGFTTFQAERGYYNRAAYNPCGCGSEGCSQPCHSCCDTAPAKTCTVTKDPTCRR